MSLDAVYRLSVIVNMVDSLTGPAAHINGVAEQTAKRLDNITKQSGDMLKTGMAMTSLGLGITKTILGPVQATFETQKALGELSSLGIKDLSALEAAGKNFSNTWAGTTKADFITAAYDIKSGISTLTDEGVARFTEMAGVTAKATKSTIAEMTSLFATGYGIYKNYYDQLSDSEFAEMFSAGIAKSVQAFKTTGSGMAQAISMLGGSATTANVPLEEQLTILGMLQATMSGSEAGTKYRQFILQAAKAGESLGLKFTDANNQLLDMPTILETIRTKYGETIDAVEKTELSKAFGSQEAVMVIDLLYDKIGAVDSNINDLYSNMQNGASTATQMANAINSPDGERYTVITQRIENLNQTLGQQLLPTMNTFLELTGAALEGVTKWAEAHPNATKAIAMTVLVIGVLLIATGSLITFVSGTIFIFTKLKITVLQLRTGLGILKNGIKTLGSHCISAGGKISSLSSKLFTFSKNAIKSGISAAKSFVVGLAGMAKQAIVTAATALPGLISATWSWTVSLLACPVTWIVIGIIALIGVIILLVKNWDLVSASMTVVWETIKLKFAEGVNFVSGLINKLIELINKIPGVNIPIIPKINIDTSQLEAAKDNLSNVKAARDSNVNVKAYAAGGIINRPTLATFAEEGPEAAIPLKRSARSIALWKKAGEFLGMNSGETDVALPANKSPKINLRQLFSIEGNTNSKESVIEKKDGVTINKLVISVDVRKLKDLNALFTLLDEIKAYIHSSGNDYDVVLEG